MGSRNSSTTLLQEIENIRRHGKNGKPYIPLQSLFRLLSREAVDTELSKNERTPIRRQQLINQITQGARRVFAILVLIKEVPLAESLMEKGLLRDSKLPIHALELKDFEELFVFKFFCRQWEVQAPIFSRGTISKKFRPEIALPFMEEEEVGNGAFGTVYKISLDSDHQVLEEGDIFSQQLVRKETKGSNSDDKELDNLATLQLLKHPNIIELLSTFEYEGNRNLIFPFAEGGTLNDIFQTEREDTPFKDDDQMLIAIAQLSSALHNVHEFVHDQLDLRLIGCHHDVRPRNILVSKNSLMLADFGLSRFGDSSENSKAPFPGGADFYLAPECSGSGDKDEKTPLVGRSSDIWSFGCILAEVATYLTHGLRGVKEFKEKRRFTIGRITSFCFHRGSKENPGVEKWISDLPGKSKSIDLLVALVRKILVLEESERPKARYITTQLERIAISEVCEAVRELFESACTLLECADTYLQLWRFEAWRFGAGLPVRGNSSVDGYLCSNVVVNFKLSLEYLLDMRDTLGSISASKTNEQFTYFRKISWINDSLLNLLSDSQQERTRTRFYSTVLESEDSSYLTELQAGVDTSALDHKLRLLKALKSMTDITEEHAGDDGTDQRLDPNSITEPEEFGGHHLALYTHYGTAQRVLVEWRRYTRQGGDKEQNKQLFTQIQNLVRLLSLRRPEEFCSLLCRGFFHDPSRTSFGIVYVSPDSRSDRRYMTLRCLIKSTVTTPIKRPTLEDRFNLAYTLAKAVREFHLVGWLHKNLVSTNVVFSLEDQTPLPELVRRPFIIGFTHSRPNEHIAFTLGVSKTNNGDHQHPAYRQNSSRYRPDFDYYSLGILLLEIGLWMPLPDLVGKISSEFSASGIRKHLIDSIVPLLGTLMGSTYRETVKTCLNGELGPTEPSEDREGTRSDLTLKFEDLVVNRLQKLKDALL